jgi:hypothetical protein
LRRHFSRYAALYAIVLVVAVAAGLTARFPVYFRTDDVQYLGWAARHTNPLSAFSASESTLFGAFRPVNVLAWWALYRAFGVNAGPYQFMITLAYGLSFLFFFAFVSTLYSRRTAVLSVIAYLAAFSYLTQTMFWLSDLTFVLEMLLVNASLCFFAMAAGRKLTWLAAAVLCYVSACLVKEPSSLIVPAVASAFLASRWHGLRLRNRRAVAAAAAAALVVGTAWIIGPGTTSLGRRQMFSLSMGWAAALDFVVARMRFYGRQLMAGPGLVLWIASVYLALTSWAERRAVATNRNALAFLAAGVAVALAAKWGASGEGAFLLLLVALVASMRPPDSAPAVWSILPLGGILTLAMMTRSYLFEASFGLSAVVGAAAADLLGRLTDGIRSLRPALGSAVWIVIAALVFCGALAELPTVRSRLHALSVVSDVRLCFRDGVQFARDRLDTEGTALVVLSHGDLEERRGRELSGESDITKARLWQTMNGRDTQVLLHLLGAENLVVRDMEWVREGAKGQVYLFAMNRAERDYLIGLDLTLDPVFEALRGTEGSWIYRLVRGGPGSETSKEEGPAAETS